MSEQARKAQDFLTEIQQEQEFFDDFQSKIDDDDFFSVFEELFNCYHIRIADIPSATIQRNIYRCKILLHDRPGFTLFPLLNEVQKITEQSSCSDLVEAALVDSGEALIAGINAGDHVYSYSEVVHIFAFKALIECLTVAYRNGHNHQLFTQEEIRRLRNADECLNIATKYFFKPAEDEVVIRNSIAEKNLRRIEKRHEPANQIKEEFLAYCLDNPHTNKSEAARTFASTLESDRPEDFRTICPSKILINAVRSLTDYERKHRKR